MQMRNPNIYSIVSCFEYNIYQYYNQRIFRTVEGHMLNCNNCLCIVPIDTHAFTPSCVHTDIQQVNPFSIL